MRINPFNHKEKENVHYFNETKQFKQRTSIRNKLNAEFYSMKRRLRKNRVFVLGIILLNLFSVSTVLAQTITTGTITGSPFCVPAAVSVPYTITGTYLPGNIFTAQLSDGSGSFASPVSIGTLISTIADTIPASIPAGTSPGTGYRIRVVSSTPAVTGTDNGIDLSIETTPAITAMTASASSDISFTVTPVNGTNGIVPAGTTYSWPAPVVTGGMTGGAASSGSPTSITGTLTNLTTTFQTATYTSNTNIRKLHWKYIYINSNSRSSNQILFIPDR